MPFYRTPELGVVHMKGTRLPQPCRQVTGFRTEPARMQVCGAFPAYLCDWPANGGRTCDADLCEAHANQVGKNRHYCQQHFREHQDAQQQPGLFTSLVQS